MRACTLSLCPSLSESMIWYSAPPAGPSPTAYTRFPSDKIPWIFFTSEQNGSTDSKRSVLLLVANQEQPAALARCQDVAVGVERHRDQRAGLLVRHKALDDELRIGQKARSFVGNYDFIAPRQHAAERAINFGGKPVGVAHPQLIPIGVRFDACPPRGVGGKTFERAASFFNDDAGHQARPRRRRCSSP